MLGDEDKPGSISNSNSARRAYLRSVSWTERSPTKPIINPRSQRNNKARSCLPPLQPLSIAKRPVEEWPRAGCDDLGVWPNNNNNNNINNPQTPSVKPPLHSPREFEFKRDKLAFFNKECSRIDDHIYLGSEAVAKNRDVLKDNGITHVLNCVGFVCPEYFKTDLVYKTLWLQDSPSEDITSILYDVFDYFEDVREQKGRVFVHCCQGVSRSTSLVIAYLMWREGRSFEDAFQFVKAAREVANPNLGFACQLLQCQKRVHAIPASPNSVLRMYRMAPHSSYDPLHLVPKMISNPSHSQLDSRGAFIVHVPKAIYVWIGKSCNSVMSNCAGAAANQVIRYERAQGPIVNIKEGEEPVEFWDALQIGGCSKEESKREEISTVPYLKAGERMVEKYDLDFQLFHKAVAGGVVPPFSVSRTGSETCLPARENGWERMRNKFASGMVKEFLTSAKQNYDSAPVMESSDMIIDACNESTPLSCDSPDCSPDRIKDTNKEVDQTDISMPITPLCGSPESFYYSPCSSPIFSSKSPALSPSTSSQSCSLPITPPCCSPDSVSYSQLNSPKFSTKSPAFSPSASDYSSSFTFSPSSSNWSDLSYLSSQHPSPSGFEASDNSSLSYNKETFSSPGRLFSSNHTQRVPNLCLPCKGSSPSIAERRGSNPPQLMILPSVEKPSKKIVPRNLVRSWSFSLSDLADGGPYQLEHDGNRDEPMLDTDFDTPVSDSKLAQENSTNDAVMSPVLYEWPTFNKVEMGCSNYVLESTLAYLLFAPEGIVSTESPGILYIWLGRDHITSKDNHLHWDEIGRNFLNEMGFPVNAALQIVRQGEETEKFMDHLTCFSFQTVK
ncbi:hypothetical protein ACFE04_025295 [Oxalis oulophora]